MKYRTLTIIAFAAMLSACASSGAGRVRTAAPPAPRPSWVDGEAPEYPRSRFITGVASADDPSAAKDRARGEIAKVFSTRITVNTSVTASEFSSGAPGAAGTSSFQSAAQNLRAVSAKDVEGAEIAGTWRDESSGAYYALAVLDRSKALSSLEGKMSELDAAGRDAAAQFSSSADKLRKAKYALKLLSVIKEREAAAADMRVLDPAGVRPPAPWIGAQKRDAADALSALDVALIMHGDRTERLAAAVIKALNGLGIGARIASSAGGADISAECPVELSAVPDTDPRSRWKWFRGKAAAALKDVKTSRIFLNFEASAKEASSTAEEARSKTETELGRKIGAEILRGIAAYLENY